MGVLEKLLVVALAGAVVTVSGIGGAATVAVAQASPTPTPAPGPLVDDRPHASPFAAFVPGDAGGPVDAGPPVDRDAPHGRGARTPAPLSCAVETATRDVAYARVEAAFVRLRSALEDLRGTRPPATVAQAADMLRMTAERAEKVIAEIGQCREGDASEPVERDGEDMDQVAERAVAAMETVYNLAKDAVLVAPATPKPPEKGKAAPAPSKTPSCDDRAYAAKKVLAASFEKYHGQNDILWKKAEARKSSAFAAVKSADKLMHDTYDATKSAILRGGCAGDAGMQLAKTAGATFERAYVAAKAAMERAAAR